MSSLSLNSLVLIKRIPITLENNQFNRKDKSDYPLIFVRYDKVIVIPDFNICAFLQTVNPNLDINTIQEYVNLFFRHINITHQFHSFKAVNKGQMGITITPQSHYDIFTQLTPLMSIPRRNQLILYPLDFVRDLLSSYNFTVTNVYLSLDNARRAQIRSTDLNLWFTKDIDVSFSLEFSFENHFSS